MELFIMCHTLIVYRFTPFTLYSIRVISPAHEITHSVVDFLRLRLSKLMVSSSMPSLLLRSWLFISSHTLLLSQLESSILFSSSADVPVSVILQRYMLPLTSIAHATADVRKCHTQRVR